ncbi:heme lyase CcmF/NrfE family subunit [Streptosporangium sandarakinum]|uniref:heme lyase CcmF/NrfE family subunit n=1 Tax=Streptosporangium sandarakinum TaxID=1260955 RepID=UPI0034448E38
MKCLLGTLALWAGAAGSAVAALAWAGLAGRRTAVAATAAASGCAAAAFAVLEWALLTRDFQVGFVARNGGWGVPPYYTFTSLWSAVEGSLVLWALVLTGCALVAGLGRDEGPHRRIAMAVLMTLCACFLALVPLAANPFREVAAPPADGPGPNPLLRGHPLMGIHPPLLYLGYLALAVPFALGVASLVAGHAGRPVVRVMRRWTLAAWAALTAGIVLGAWWSYGVLGWGGYWEWDPVENASIVPWFTATASLHSLAVRDRHGSLGPRTAALATAGFPLALLGTFLTRGGAVASVHSFTRSAVGPPLLGILTATLIATCGLLVWRAGRLRRAGEVPGGDGRGTPVGNASGDGHGTPVGNARGDGHGTPAGGARGDGRGTLVGVGVALLVTLAFTVLLGTLYPLIVKVLDGTDVSVGPPYFNRVTVPLALALLVLMAVAPLIPPNRARPPLRRLAWPVAAGAATVAALGFGGLGGSVGPGGFGGSGGPGGGHGPLPLVAFGLGAFVLAATALRVRDVAGRHGPAAPVHASVRRRLGGSAVHAGVALAAVAIAGSSAYTHDTRGRLEPGDTLRAGGYVLRLDGVERRRDADAMSVAARVSVLEDGRPAGTLRPSITFYPASGAPPVGVPAVRTGPLADLHVTVSEVDPADGTAVLHAAVNPLMALLWTSGAVMVLGALAALPRPGVRRPRRSRHPRRAQRTRRTRWTRWTPSARIGGTEAPAAAVREAPGGPGVDGRETVGGPVR